MSEPCHTITERRSPPPRPASVTLSPLKGTTNSSELHPNQAVVLDEVGEGEMVENKLVIPDEMVHYLSQVADNHNNEFGATMNWTESNTNNTQKPLPSPSQALPSPSTLSQVLPSPSSNLNPPLPSPQSTNLLSPSMNHVVPSPSGTINQMIPSPASNMNHMLPSPSGTYQVLHSPSTNNYNTIQNPMLSPVPSLNQIASSPAAKMNQMIPSPMSTRSHSQIMSPNIQQQNPCYNRPINQGSCYPQGVSWEQNPSCHNPNMMPQQNEQYNACPNNNDYSCRQQVQMNTSYVPMMNSGNAGPCTNHNNYQPLTHITRQDTYQRTLEYVQNCQSWVSNSDYVNSSGINPITKCGDTTSNMVVNDMTSSLSSLLEENRYLQMIQ